MANSPLYRRRPPARQPPTPSSKPPSRSTPQQRYHRTPVGVGTGKPNGRFANLSAGLADHLRGRPLVILASALALLLLITLPLALLLGRNDDSEVRTEVAADDITSSPPDAQEESPLAPSTTTPDDPPTTVAEPEPPPPTTTVTNEPEPEPNPPPPTTTVTNEPEPEPNPPPPTTAAVTTPESPPTTEPDIPEPSPSTTTSNTPDDPPPTTTAAPPAQEPNPEPEPDWNEIARSVVVVWARGCQWGGSGTVVLNGEYILTNAHVVLTEAGRTCTDIQVGFIDTFEDEPSGWISATLVATEWEIWNFVPDLAVLKLSRRVDRPSIPVAAHQLELNEEITVLGFPEFGGQTITSVSGVYAGMDEDNGYDVLKTDADISSGNSGGAAFDSQGHFIGVPTYIRFAESGAGVLGRLISSKDAARFLERNVDD